MLCALLSSRLPFGSPAIRQLLYSTSIGALALGSCPIVASAQTSARDGQGSALPAPSENAGTAFQDCANKCPVMIVIPAGTFVMGTSSDAPKEVDGFPLPSYLQHQVTIAKPFVISRFEVTFAEWDACVSTGACPHVNDSWGRGEMPVTNVSWVQAQQYVTWLSQMTGQKYRLPSESEWEYVARAGTATSYHWGTDIGRGNANCAVCGSRWDDEQASPVGSFKPNAFGLFDLNGNVWEWVEDTWHDDYHGAPTDGSAWLGSDPNTRVARGGSWRNEAYHLRADFRVERNILVQFDTLGFRVARSLAP